MLKAPKRNDSGQPYGMILEELGKEYVESILAYYDGRMRRFSLSATRLKRNLDKDIAKGRKKFSKNDLILIERLNELNLSCNENSHIEWIKDVFSAQKYMENDEINPVTRELVDEFDYVLGNEAGGGFLNDEGYKNFRQRLIGELAKIYNEEIKFLGVILRTLVLSVAVVDKWQACKNNKQSRKLGYPV